MSGADAAPARCVATRALPRIPREVFRSPPAWFTVLRNIIPPHAPACETLCEVWLAACRKLLLPVIYPHMSYADTQLCASANIGCRLWYVPPMSATLQCVISATLIAMSAWKTRTLVMSYILKPAGGHATELLAPHAESLVVSRPPNCQPVTRYSSGSFCLPAPIFDFTNEPGCFVMPFSGKDTIKGATLISCRLIDL